MRATLREIDWSKTPLGPPESWPQSLRVPIGICLSSRSSMAIWWGPDWTIFYNDAYKPIPGKRHPWALGKSARVVWAEVWPSISAQLDAVLRGESSVNDRALLPTDRNGTMEDAWFTWSFSPIFDETGSVTGAFVLATEETAQVLRERELIETQHNLTVARDRLALTLAAAEIGSWSLDALTGLVIADANLATAFSVAVEVAETGTPLQVFIDAIHPEDRPRIVAAITEAMASRDSFEAEYRLTPKGGALRWVLARGRVARDNAGRTIAMSGVLIDITGRKRSEQIVAAQREILRLVASEPSLARVLDELARHLEAASEGILVSIHRIEDGLLLHGGAPSFPAEFNRAIDGMPIGENVGTCGRAAFLREAVFTADLGTDPNWASFSERALALGVRAAWAVPIISRDGEVIGTIAIFFRVARPPTLVEKDAADFLVKTAAIAIERSRAEQVLREGEGRFRLLADNISQFAWIADGQGSITWYNQRWFDYTGTTLETMQGWGWQAVHHPDHVERVTAKFVRHVKEGIEWEDTFPLRGANGDYRWFLSRAFPIRDVTGQVMQWFGTNTDITGLREVQEELRQRDQRFRQVADTMPQIVWGADTDGNLDYYNRRWFEFVGVPEGEMEAARWDKYIHPEDLPATAQTWAAALVSGKTYQREFRARDAGGIYHWFLTRALPVKDSEGKIVRWFGTCTDIDDRKAIHEESLQIIERERTARLASENAGRMKDDFLATLSHELRTPLNPVLLLASEGATNLSLPAETRADFDAIAKNVALEARLIDDLLDLTRITRGKMALSVAPADLHSVLTDALANVAPEIAEKRIKVIMNLLGTAPVVVADTVRLQQVFWNILRNAAKFTPIGGTVTVTSQLTDDGQRVEILIADSGMGMNPEEVGRLFNAFVQGDHAGTAGSHRFGGLGLGLAISRMLVELHSGRITGSSAGMGRGSTFSVQLPLADRFKNVFAPDVVTEVPNLPAEIPGKALKILLVEDHEPTRVSLKHLLMRRRYEVHEAGSVTEAIAIAAITQFDLLLTDIGLPDGDGYQVMQALRQSQNLQGIALTGYGMQEDIDRSKLGGFAGHLTKPIRVQDLEAALAAAAKLVP